MQSRKIAIGDALAAKVVKSFPIAIVGARQNVVI